MRVFFLSHDHTLYDSLCLPLFFLLFLPSFFFFGVFSFLVLSFGGCYSGNGPQHVSLLTDHSPRHSSCKEISPTLYICVSVYMSIRLSPHPTYSDEQNRQ
jgi:hypothetical protein